MRYLERSIKSFSADYIIKAREAKKVYEDVLEQDKPLADAQKNYDQAKSAYSSAKMSTERLTEVFLMCLNLLVQLKLSICLENKLIVMYIAWTRWLLFQMAF